eukprot:gene26062-21337_t
MAEAPPSYEAPADAKGKDGGGGGGGGAAAGAAAAAAPPMYTKGAITYTYVSACQACVYLVRSDGIVDRSSSGGKVTQQMLPPEGSKYVAVGADSYASYLLTDKGVVVRTTGGGKTSFPASEVRPPPGLTYVAVGAGPVASYFVRSD